MTAKYVEQLGLMLEFEQMVAARVGAPGCAARLKAADNALALTWALAWIKRETARMDALRAIADQCHPPVYGSLSPSIVVEPKPLTMTEAARNAGLGNFVGTTGTWVEELPTFLTDIQGNRIDLVRSEGVTYEWRDGRYAPVTS